MSATVVDPNFYYQQMRPEGQGYSAKSPVVTPKSASYITAGPPTYKEAYPRSPKSPRKLAPVVRPVYDDRVQGVAGSQAFAEAQIIVNPMTRRHYYRSVSSLDISMEEDDTPKPTLLKEFSGSASSIDFGKTGGNIRYLFDQLRHGKPVTGNSSANSLSSLQNSDGSGSGSGVLCASKKGKSAKDKSKKSSLRTRSSIFRKIRGTPSETGSGTIEVDALSTGSADGDRIRRRIFAHYDTQSMLTRLIPTEEAQLLTIRRNTTTGASAANFTTRCVLPSSDGNAGSTGEEIDQGDGKCNNLLLSCPYFRNEIAPEDCSLSVSPASLAGVIMRRPQGRKSLLPSFRPHQGSLVVEEDELISRVQCVQLSQPKFEHIDNGASYYRKYFHGEEHSNYFGVDEKIGPIAISLKKEKTLHSSNKNLYRVIIRTSELRNLRGSLLEDSLPRVGRDSIRAKDIIDCLVPEVQTACLKLGTQDLKTQELLLKLDEQAVPTTYKVGIMYCKAGQCTEEEMYNNENAGPAFDEFLDLLGQRVRLKCFDKYRAQLDNKSDSTGLYSLYAAYGKNEIMFHVSTMLPHTPSNKQQLLRKRHIGNDIVTIVFQEPNSLPFSPKTIRSHFQHVFIVVRAQNPNTDHTQYKVSVSRSRDVPPFGPPLPESTVFNKDSEFVDFLLTKVINAENAAHKSDKFVALATRTRQEYLKDLAHNYVTHSGIDSGFGKLTMFSLSTKKKDKPIMSFLPDAALRGALAWSVQARDFDMVAPLNGRVIFGVSANYIVLMDPVSGSVTRIIPNSNIMAWKSQEESLSIYYHAGETLQVLCDSAEDWKEIIQRLKAVTNGIEVVDLTLTRNVHGHLGFHTQFNGVITDVESNSGAWKVGLRRGCCLLEICGRSVNLLDHQMMADLLRRANPVTVAVLPPLDNGMPKRGCSRPLCNKAPEHVMSANYDNLSESVESLPQPVYSHPVTSRSTSSLVDGHVAFYLKSDGSANALVPDTVASDPSNHEEKFQPSLDDLEAESRWWANQMAEETARLNRLLPQMPPPPQTWTPSHEQRRVYPEYANGVTVDLRPTRPFERKLSPNSGVPLFDSGTDTMSSTTSKSSSRSHNDHRPRPGSSASPPIRSHVRHHKTDPGFRPPPPLPSATNRAPLRNSPNKSSLKKGQNRQSVNLQEELLKLINPELINSDRLSFQTSTGQMQSPGDLARRGSDDTPHRGSQSVDSPSPPTPMSKSLEAIPLPPPPQRLNWRSLVITAEEAAKNAHEVSYPQVSSESSSTSPDGVVIIPKSPPPLRPRSSSRKHYSRPESVELFEPDRFVSAERIQELEDRITKLILDLNKEREDRMALESQVRELKYNNHRLQDDSPPGPSSYPVFHAPPAPPLQRQAPRAPVLSTVPQDTTVTDSVPF